MDGLDGLDGLDGFDGFDGFDVEGITNCIYIIDRYRYTNK
jgi:hypothetical protein